METDEWLPDWFTPSIRPPPRSSSETNYALLRFCISAFVSVVGKATLSEGNSFLKRPPPPPSDIRLSSFEEDEGEKAMEAVQINLPLSLSLVCFSPAVNYLVLSVGELIRICFGRLPRSDPPLPQMPASECLHSILSPSRRAMKEPTGRIG